MLCVLLFLHAFEMALVTILGFSCVKAYSRVHGAATEQYIDMFVTWQDRVQGESPAFWRDALRLGWSLCDLCLTYSWSLQTTAWQISWLLLFLGVEERRCAISHSVSTGLNSLPVKGEIRHEGKWRHMSLSSPSHTRKQAVVTQFCAFAYFSHSRKLFLWNRKC